MPIRSPQRPTSRARLYPAGTATATVMTATATTTTRVLRTQRGKSVCPSSSFTCSSVGGSLKIHGMWLRSDAPHPVDLRSEERTSELQSQSNLVCRLLLEKKKNKNIHTSLVQ